MLADLMTNLQKGLGVGVGVEMRLRLVVVIDLEEMFNRDEFWLVVIDHMLAVLDHMWIDIDSLLKWT